HLPPTLLPFFLRDGSITPCPCSVVVRRDVALRLGGFGAADFRNPHEDQVFYTKVCLTVPVLRLQECLARYRKHSHSMCATSPLPREISRRQYLDWVRDHLQETGVTDAEVWEALRDEYGKL